MKCVCKLVLSCTAVLYFFCGPQSPAQCPLPDDIALTPPSNSLPRDLAAFAGAWGGGAWGGNLPTFLVVERVNADGTAGVVYSWGNWQERKLKAGWEHLAGKISNGILHLASGDGTEIAYTLEKSGSLYGRYTRQNRPTSVELVRVAGIDKKTVMAAAARPVRQTWAEIRIPEHSKVGETAGKTLTLQTTFYRTGLSGRNPVVIFNHGSTGSGIIPVSLVERAWDPALVFRSLGYTVVVPMRKGRGTSDGIVIEESAAPGEIQLDSAVEDLDAVVEYLKTQPYVDPARIVLVGQSRGGFLAVIYAGRHPEKVAGVLNFSGGWWGEHMPTAGFNLTGFRQAGRTATVPMLWLYAGHDSFYSLAYTEKNFREFRTAGGKGQLFEVPDIQGEGHFLVNWPEKWVNTATAFLQGIESNRSTTPHIP